MNTTGKTNTITQIALMAALQCIISPFAITFPFSPVPISLATLMLYISVYILGKKNAVISCGIYLLIGFVGIPVFSGFTGGIGKVLGPTGGYLIGYVFLVYICGWFVEWWNEWPGKNSVANERNPRCYIGCFMQGIGMAMGTAVCYLLGTVWLSYQAGMDFMVALGVGVFPFILGDIVKIVAAVLIGINVRKRLVRAGVV